MVTAAICVVGDLVSSPFIAKEMNTHCLLVHTSLQSGLASAFDRSQLQNRICPTDWSVLLRGEKCQFESPQAQEGF